VRRKTKQLIMKRRRFITLIGASAGFHASAWAAVTAARELPGGAQFTVDGGLLRIQFWSPDTVRITYATGAELPALKSLSVVSSRRRCARRASKTLRLTLWRLHA